MMEMEPKPKMEMRMDRELEWELPMTWKFPELSSIMENVRS